MELSTQPMTQVIEAYKAAVFAQDVEALCGLYAQDAVVFDLWSTWSYAGLAAWRQAVSAWFGSLGDERVEVRLDDVSAATTGDLALVHAIITYQSLNADGQPLRAMQNRLTWALKQRGDGWKIIHEHTSAPIDGETFKVILER